MLNSPKHSHDKNIHEKNECGFGKKSSNTNSKITSAKNFSWGDATQNSPKNTEPIRNIARQAMSFFKNLGRQYFISLGIILPAYFAKKQKGSKTPWTAPNAASFKIHEYVFVFSSKNSWLMRSIASDIKKQTVASGELSKKYSAPKCRSRKNQKFWAERLVKVFIKRQHRQKHKGKEQIYCQYAACIGKSVAE